MRRPVTGGQDPDPSQKTASPSKSGDSSPADKPKKVRRRKYGSIQMTIIQLFLIVLLLVTLVSGIFNYRLQYDRIVKETENKAFNGMELSLIALQGTDYSHYITPGVYASSRIMLRSICQKFEMRYLSIWIYDNESRKDFFVFAVASSDEEDAQVRRERAYGTLVKVEHSAPELASMKGITSRDYWITHNQYGRVISWSMPITDTSGKVRAVINADFEAASFENYILHSVIVQVVVISVILLALLAIQLLLLRHRVFSPLSQISRQMSDFASGESLQTPPLAITTKDEMQEIAEAFEDMTEDIRTYMENQQRVANEKAQQKALLDTARNIQYGMVPASMHLAGKTCEVQASMRTAREIGGDFYDCFFRRDGNLCVLMADVSGKGLTAALFMAMAKSILHELLSTGASPATALNRANDELCVQNPEGMFVTVFAMVLDPRTGIVTSANAGHNPPVLYGVGGSRAYTPSPGIALALFEDAGIEDEFFTLSPGTGIFLYTDGVTEAVSKDKAFYGFPRLVELLDSASASTKEVIDTVTESVEAFSEGTEQFDDITLAAVYFEGSPDYFPNDDTHTSKANGSSPDEAADSRSETSLNVSHEMTTAGKEGTLPVTLDAFDIIKEGIQAYVGSKSPRFLEIVLAAEEAFVNIVQYSGATAISYVLAKSGSKLTLILMDDGISFDPFAPRPEKNFEDFENGGMGILFIRQISTNVRWERRDNRNCLTMEFAL